MNKILEKKTVYIRALIFVGVLIVILSFPWWVSLPVCLALVIYFPLYGEVLFFGFLFDTLYWAGSSFPYPTLTVTFLILIIVHFIKSQLRT